MIEKYSYCNECEQYKPSKDMVYVVEDIQNYLDRESLDEYISDPDEEVEMIQVCKDCSVQCHECRDYYEMESDIIDKCDICNKNVCLFDHKYCTLCNKSYCNHPRSSTDKKTCYQVHREKESFCKRCEKTKIMLYDDIGWETRLFCPYCDENKEDFLISAMERPSCPLTNDEYSIRTNKDHEFRNSSEEYQEAARKQWRDKVRKQWDGYYLSAMSTTIKI